MKKLFKVLRAPIGAVIFALGSTVAFADEPGGHNTGPGTDEANEEWVSGDVPTAEPVDDDEPTGENQGPPGGG